MTTEVSILISAVSVAVALYSGIGRMKRNSKQNTANDAAQLTTVIVKLENISSGVTEIKSELKNVKNDIQDLRGRLITVEQSTKSAHHRIDGLTVSQDNEWAQKAQAEVFQTDPDCCGGRHCSDDGLPFYYGLANK